MPTAPRVSEIIVVINTLKRSKAAELDVPPVEFFHVASAVLEKSIRLECNDRKGVCMLPGVAKIIAKLF